MIGLGRDGDGLKQGEMAHAAGGVEELIEGLDLFGAEIGDQGVGGLLARAGTSRAAGAFDGGDGRQQNPGLAQGGDHAHRNRHPLVGRPCRSRGRLDHEGNIGAGWPPKPQTRRQLTGMIRHCLIPRRIVGQLGYVQTKLLRDESGEIMGYCSPVLYQLRKRDARVPQERELQRHAQLVPSLPSRSDDLDIGRLEGIEPGQMIAIGRDGEDLIAFALGQELMLALRHAVSCPQKVIWAYGQRGVKRHSMWTDMGGAQRLPSIASTERPFGRRMAWATFWAMPASAPAIRT